MFLHPKPKRIQLSILEKLWIIRHNKNISKGKVALDFSSGFEIDLQYLLVLVTAHAISCIIQAA